MTSLRDPASVRCVSEALGSAGSGWWRLLLTGALLLAVPTRHAHAAEPADAFEAEAQRVLQQPDLQRLPPVERRERPAGENLALEPADRSQSERDGQRISSSTSSFAELVGIAILGVLGFLLLLALLRSFQERRARGHERSSPERAGQAAERSAARSSQREPWLSLADSGQYSEAVHSMLLAALSGMTEASRKGRALTSREVLAIARLGPERRRALEDIIRTVEHSFFGGAVLGLADYQRCRQAFELFRTVEQGA